MRALVFFRGVCKKGTSRKSAKNVRLLCKVEELKGSYDYLKEGPSLQFLGTAQASHSSAVSLRPPVTTTVTQVSLRYQKQGEFSGTTWSCRGCTGEAPASAYWSLAGLQEKLCSPEEAHHDAPLAGQLGLRPQRGTLSSAVGSTLAAPLVTPGPGRPHRSQDDPHLTPCRLYTLSVPQPAARLCNLGGGRAARAPSARACRNAPTGPHKQPRTSLFPHGRARGGALLPAGWRLGTAGRRRLGELRGYHAAQADVLVVGEDEHHVGPSRLPGCAHRAQHQ